MKKTSIGTTTTAWLMRTRSATTKRTFARGSEESEPSDAFNAKTTRRTRRNTELLRTIQLIISGDI